jgi:peptide-methionine (S)-S-oxide reductase
VRVAYDPDRCTYDDLLGVFWGAHDPTRAPFKRQYQPALFPFTEAQAERARAARDAVAARHDDAITTEIIAEPAFYRAELYHQKHSLRHYDVLMDPLRTLYPADDAFVDSPAVALINGYVGGHRDPARLADDRSRLGLPDEMFDALRTIAERRYA